MIFEHTPVNQLSHLCLKSVLKTYSHTHEQTLLDRTTQGIYAGDAVKFDIIQISGRERLILSFHHQQRNNVLRLSRHTPY
jgi:hypothetical protein